MPNSPATLSSAPTGPGRGKARTSVLPRRRRRHHHGNPIRVLYGADLHRRPLGLRADEQQTLEEVVEEGRKKRAAAGHPLAPPRWRAP